MSLPFQETTLVPLAKLQLQMKTLSPSVLRGLPTVSLHFKPVYLRLVGSLVGDGFYNVEYETELQMPFKGVILLKNCDFIIKGKDLVLLLKGADVVSEDCCISALGEVLLSRNALIASLIHLTRHKAMSSTCYLYSNYRKALESQGYLRDVGQQLMHTNTATFEFSIGSLASDAPDDFMPSPAKGQTALATTNKVALGMGSNSKQRTEEFSRQRQSKYQPLASQDDLLGAIAKPAGFLCPTAVSPPVQVVEGIFSADFGEEELFEAMEVDDSTGALELIQLDPGDLSEFPGFALDYLSYVYRLA
jgi:hypothetical protein